MSQQSYSWAYEPAIPLLGIYTENIITWKDIGNPVFTVALFIIAKAWKPWETYMQVREQQLELDMEQQTGSK